ncbi:MAG TPA: M56 family metallopeptidase [Flavisolibacter sp.]|nr:M56 family metallopeptidase [Flavisolibacter sp.]
MAHWSQSHFLQALGWATLNSFWQMAVLWTAFVAANYFFKLSATKKYQASVGAMLIGFGWFVTTFVLYYQNNSSSYAFFENTIPHSDSFLNICLISASVTYLFLLVFPAIRLFKNWQFVQVIKKDGLSKADLNYRLFVQNVAGHLGITKKVKLVVSNLVSSPVTIGYLKPMILLPVAAMNQLSTVQVEAILLHELSHIRRYDYLVNFIVSIIHTLLYFNPFVKFFMNTIENERENCCDELVLQFGYDKVGYASALLHLEKTSGKHKALTLAAAGKQNLLTRIEKIVGMEKKKTFRLVQIVPLFLAMVCVLLFNSVLIIKDAQSGKTMAYAGDTVFMPWQLNKKKGQSKSVPSLIEQPAAPQQLRESVASSGEIKIDILTMPAQPSVETEEAESLVNAGTEHFIPVNFDAVDGNLTKEEKDNVRHTVDATKKVVSEMQWKEIEASLAEVMDKKEKALAKHEYMLEVDKVNWHNIEQNLKANYDKLNWELINRNINKAMAQVQLDSIQKVYSQALEELEKMEKELKCKGKVNCTAIPDASMAELNIAKETLRKNIESIKAVSRPKKVVRL